MVNEYFKMAFASIRRSKLRSILTMFGIVVGVSSVVTIVGLGEGVRHQIAGQIGADQDRLIVVQPGKNRDNGLFNLDTFSELSQKGSLSNKDWRDIKDVQGVDKVAPIGVISGLATYGDREFGGNILATTDGFDDILGQPVEFGSFIEPETEKSNFAVIGRRVAEDLFQENDPIGRTLTIRGVDYRVNGIFKNQNSGSLSAINVNESIVLPYQAAEANGSNIQVAEIFLRTTDAAKTEEIATHVGDVIQTNHAGQRDFSVLSQSEALQSTNKTFYQLTVFTAAVASISFIVGGIGIMNIMFATVSERTREIGIRKAIGASSRQILGQFVVESIVISFLGACIGVALSLIANGLIRVNSNMQPIITWQVCVVVFILSVLTGIVSGILPAAQAARKDPITALRRET